LKYSDAIGFLNSLVNYEKLAKPRNGFKLDDIRNLLELAGKPHEKLKHIILVAGTKGKGSVCYMLEAALRGCGMRTGMFLSPHVSTVRERIQIDGRPVSKRRFSHLVEQYVLLVKKQPVSYFELCAAMAFETFARAEVDYAVVEVGLGGRLDATNLAEPDVSVITRIGFDHLRVLGGSIGKIAREKAGIMRYGKPVVIGKQAAVAGWELEHEVHKKGAVLITAAKQVRVWDIRTSDTKVRFSAFGELGAARFSLPLLGRHQVENCRTVLAVLGLLGRADRHIRLGAVEHGLRDIVIPARCQIVKQNPFIIVDSCHNPDSGQALADVIREYLREQVVLVYGSLRSKLISQTVKPLALWVEKAVLVRPDSPRAAELGRLRHIFGRLGIPYQSADNIKSALAQARALTGNKKPLVVAGSFYLAGEALQCLGLATGN